MDATPITPASIPPEYKPLPIGIRAENKINQIMFDFSTWAELYGAGVVQLLVKRPGDAAAYPVELEQSGTTATWTISSTDIAKNGLVRAEYVYTVGEAVKKSTVGYYYVFEDIGGTGDPPDPYEDWLEQLTALAAETQQAAIDAEAASEAVQDMGVEAEALSPGATPTVTKFVDPETGAVTLVFGLPSGGGGGGAVNSVNGKTGVVTLDASDVGALPSDTDLEDIPDGSTYKRATAAQLEQIATNATDIGALDGRVDDKLDKTGNGSNVTAAFSTASSRANITTGEKLSVLFGKIAKWLGDLGTAAFRAATATLEVGSTALIEAGAVASALADKLPNSTKYAGSQSIGGAADKAVSIPMGAVDGASTSTAFTATVDGITELRDGVCVWLTNGVVTSAAGCTLDINGIGAKPIYNSIAAATATTTAFNVNYTMLFIYNSSRVTGGCWDMVYGYDSNTTYTLPKLGCGYTTCSTAEATAAKTAELSGYALTTGGYVMVKFTYAVGTGATLNIASKGAKAIYYQGAAITDGIIKAGDTVLLCYSTYYHVVAVDRWGADIAGKAASDLGVTGASVGDLVKISAIDANGKPTSFAKATAGTDYQAPLTAGTDYATPASVSTLSAPTAITLADNTVYYLSDVASLTLTYPASGHWACLIVLTTAASGTVTVTLPTSSYIGTAPTFGNSETWELSIRDGVVVAGKCEAAS